LELGTAADFIADTSLLLVKIKMKEQPLQLMQTACMHTVHVPRVQIMFSDTIVKDNQRISEYFVDTTYSNY
jgi:hypothetical protein